MTNADLKRLEKLLKAHGIKRIVDALKLLAFENISPGTDWDLWYQGLGSALITIETNKKQRQLINRS